MCGICGVISLDKIKNDKYVDYMNELQNRRGPDHTGKFECDTLCMGQNRLSIQDISENANQPYLYKHLVMVFNGEIYNYNEVKQQLIEDYNVLFTTNSDTEVLIKLFYYYDKEFVLNRLEGMFSIALYDKRKNIVSFMRDRLGEKPLYYYKDENQFIFASMPAPIAKLLNKYENKKFNIDYECLNFYLSSGTLLIGKSLFDNILSLKPGELLEININDNTCKIEKWWKLNLTKKTYDLEYITNTIKQSVINTEIGDRPGMLLFSGGNDSGVISLYLKNFDFLTLCNGEEKKSAEFLKELKTEQKIEYIDKEFVNNNCDKLFDRYKEIVDFSGILSRSSFPVILTTLYLEKFKPETKIILTGNGGDELFYGYSHMSKEESCVKSINTLYGFADYWTTDNIYLNEKKKKFLDDKEKLHELYKPPQGLSKENFGRWLELNQYLVGDLNVDSDIVFMYSSIECRTPFLNNKLMENVLSMEPSNFFYTEEDIKKYTDGLYSDHLEDWEKEHIKFTNKSKKPLKEILLNANISAKNIFRTKYGYGYNEIPEKINDKIVQFREEFLKRNIVKVNNENFYFDMILVPLLFFFESFDYLLNNDDDGNPSEPLFKPTNDNISFQRMNMSYTSTLLGDDEDKKNKESTNNKIKNNVMLSFSKGREFMYLNKDKNEKKNKVDKSIL